MNLSTKIFVELNWALQSDTSKRAHCGDGGGGGVESLHFDQVSAINTLDFPADA